MDCFRTQWCQCLDETAEDGKSPPSDEERDALCFGGSEEMEFVPMIWQPDGWTSEKRKYDNSNLTESDTIFLSFNEPDRPDQSNIPAELAAQYHYDLGLRYPDKVFLLNFTFLVTVS